MKNNHKYMIVGFHDSGKQEIADDLSQNGFRVGKNFISLADTPSDAYFLNTTIYPAQDIDALFENQAYIFIQKKFIDGETYYEGLSLYEYDNNDVFVMSPDQFNLIPSIANNVTIVWLDNNLSNRRARFLTERRKYDFNKLEKFEKQDMMEFIEKINAGPAKVLYFNNEEPLRVSAIVAALIKAPSLLPLFAARFN